MDNDTFRRRLEGVSRLVRSAQERRATGATMVGRMVSTTPSGTNKYWLVDPQDISGTEAEGEDADTEQTGDQVFGLHFQEPTEDQLYVYHLVNGRWVAGRSIGEPVPGCEECCPGVFGPGSSLFLYGTEVPWVSISEDCVDEFYWNSPSNDDEILIRTRCDTPGTVILSYLYHAVSGEGAANPPCYPEGSFTDEYEYDESYEDCGGPYSAPCDEVYWPITKMRFAPGDCGFGEDCEDISYFNAVVYSGDVERDTDCCENVSSFLELTHSGAVPGTLEMVWREDFSYGGVSYTQDGWYVAYGVVSVYALMYQLYCDGTDWTLKIYEYVGGSVANTYTVTWSTYDCDPFELPSTEVTGLEGTYVSVVPS